MTSRIAYNNPDCRGSFGLPYHYELLSDRRRLGPLRRAIESKAKGRRVLESGTGSGILSILAARAGALRVYATEADPKMARIARDNVAKSGYSHVVRIIEKETRCLTLRDIDDVLADLVIAEHLSTWQVTEAQVPVMNHINSVLATRTAIRIPESLINRAELVYSKFRFEDIVELRTIYFGFTGVKKPLLLSDPVDVHHVTFGAVNPMFVSRNAKLRASRTGVVNSIRLTSPLTVFGKIHFKSSDSLLPPVIVPLEDDLSVSAGDLVDLHVEYECETDWSAFRCAAKLVPRRKLTARLNQRLSSEMLLAHSVENVVLDQIGRDGF